MKLRELTVLLAEDQEDDVFLMSRALRKVVEPYALQVVRDGEEAVAYLRGVGEYADRVRFPFPNVLMLDIKMPRMSGLDVLHWLAAHEECSVIPTIVFSSSEQPRDVREAFASRANAYFTKPMGFDEWVGLMSAIFSYWSRSHVPEPPPQKVCR